MISSHLFSFLTIFSFLKGHITVPFFKKDLLLKHMQDDFWRSIGGAGHSHWKIVISEDYCGIRVMQFFLLLHENLTLSQLSGFVPRAICENWNVNCVMGEYCFGWNRYPTGRLHLSWKMINTLWYCDFLRIMILVCSWGGPLWVPQKPMKLLGNILVPVVQEFFQQWWLSLLPVEYFL